MKALWIVGLGLALCGCGLPPSETRIAFATMEVTAASPLTVVSNRGVSNRGISNRGERPQEIVGTENHRAVLDGAS